MKNKSIIWEERDKLLPVPESLPFNVFCEQLLDFTCEFCKITKEKLLLKTRKREIVILRQFCHYIAYSIYNKPNEIGIFFGNKDDATVRHSKKVISTLLDVHPETRDKFLPFNNAFVERLNK